MEHTNPCRMGDGIRAAHGVELFQQRCDVVLGGVRRNAEPPGNLLVRRALRQQCKHFQFPRREHNAGIRPGRRVGRDDKRVRFIVFTDQLEPFNVGQSGRDPISESRVSHVDRQPQPISHARFNQAAGLSPI